MKQVLWINSCMRGAGQSRTLELCRTFLEELRVRRPGLKVAERDLTRAELPVMTAELSPAQGGAGRGGAGGPAAPPRPGDGPGGSGGGGSPLLGSGIPGGAEGLSGVGLHTGDHIWIHTGGGAAGAVPGRAADLYYHLPAGRWRIGISDMSMSEGWPGCWGSSIPTASLPRDWISGAMTRRPFCGRPRSGPPAGRRDLRKHSRQYAGGCVFFCDAAGVHVSTTR